MIFPDPGSTVTTMSAASGDSTAADETHQKQDDGDDEQDVDERANRIARHEAERPQDQQNDGECVQHGFTLGQVGCNARAIA
jgi:hypothetical protein